MKRRVASTLVLGALAFAGAALGAGSLTGAASFADTAGDDNAAPDITSVTVVDSTAEAITIKVAVSNYPTLIGSMWINLFFDLDSNAQTGILGSEALVRYLANGSTELHLQNGFSFVRRPGAHGISGTYTAGQLTISIPRAALNGADPLGIFVVSSRQQSIGLATYVASDVAPDEGHFGWTTTPKALSDPDSDHEVAPDITSVRVTDTPTGWIRFAITTPNYEKLRGPTLVALAVDADSRASTGDRGADYAIGHIDGVVYLERWSDAISDWVAVPGRRLTRTRNAGNVVTIEIHRSELGDRRQLGFRVTAAVIHFATGTAFAVDVAPDNLVLYWRYRLTETAPLRLLAGKTGVSRRVRLGAPFTISVPVRRSDTKQAIVSGSASCILRVDGKRVRATGSVAGGRGQCAFLLRKRGVTVAGEMTVRSLRTSITKRFSLRIR